MVASRWAHAATSSTAESATHAIAHASILRPTLTTRPDAKVTNPAQQQTRSKLLERLAEKDINKEVFISELPELGLIIMDSPDDPEPSIRIQNGRIVEMDGRVYDDFDVIDHFIAKHGIDLDVAGEAMAMPTRNIARMLVDINVTQREVMRIMAGCTAKLVAIMTELNVVEMMMAMQKMRQRRQPADQAHVTNWKENPALLAADAAEAGLRGFAEAETTVRVARNAPFNALAYSSARRLGVLAS